MSVQLSAHDFDVLHRDAEAAKEALIACQLSLARARDARERDRGGRIAPLAGVVDMIMDRENSTVDDARDHLVAAHARLERIRERWPEARSWFAAEIDVSSVAGIVDHLTGGLPELLADLHIEQQVATSAVSVDAVLDEVGLLLARLRALREHLPASEAPAIAAPPHPGEPPAGSRVRLEVDGQVRRLVLPSASLGHWNWLLALAWIGSIVMTVRYTSRFIDAPPEVWVVLGIMWAGIFVGTYRAWRRIAGGAVVEREGELVRIRQHGRTVEADRRDLLVTLDEGGKQELKQILPVKGRASLVLHHGPAIKRLLPGQPPATLRWGKTALDWLIA
jgi:hypothetical protein